MISFTLHLKTKNLTNERSHWAVKAKRAKAERTAAMVKCPKWAGGPLLVVSFTRYGTREMDDDGLRAALKGVRDGISSRLGLDDGSRLVRFEYAQATCKAGEERVGVVVEVAT